MNVKTLSVIVATIVLASGSAFAQDKANCPACPTAKKACGACPSTSTVALNDDDKACPVSLAMGKLPKFTYKIGDKETCCGESAAALAKEHDKPVHFVVAGKSYEDKAAAYTAYVEVTEKFVNDFATPHTCEKSGTTTIAGQACNCPVKAGETSKLVKAAMGKVKMTYVVGKESCDCPTHAGEIAKKSGESIHYVIGDAKTTCNMTARVNLAHAKYKAAVQALQPVAKKEKKDS